MYMYLFRGVVVVGGSRRFASVASVPEPTQSTRHLRLCVTRAYARRERTTVGLESKVTRQCGETSNGFGFGCDCFSGDFGVGNVEV